MMADVLLHACGSLKDHVNRLCMCCSKGVWHPGLCLLPARQSACFCCGGTPGAQLLLG